MSCNKCNQINNNCGCTQTYVHQNICNECPPQVCDCPISDLSTDCVLYNQDDIVCDNVVVVAKNTILSDALNNIVSWSCQRFADIQNYFRLINIGTGSEIYAGVNLLGEKKLRKLNSGSPIVTVVQNAEDITFGIDENELNDFIETNQKTYTVANVGTGSQAFKDTTIVGDNTQFNFRSVVKEDLGMGESFLRDIQQNTDELNVRVKTLVSDNLSITSTDDEVRIETPTTASIPALYVNNLYEPAYEEWLRENTIQNSGIPIVGFVFRGKGTLAQPFTDSTVYPLLGGSPTITPDTAIQNALDGDAGYTITYSYVGNGTRLAPDRVGEKIIIQDNTTSYNFAGNFGYSRLYIEVGGNINHTDTGLLFDMDNATHFNVLSDSITIDILDGYEIISSGNGLNNSGSNVATNNFSQSRSAVLKGKGTLFFPNTDITKYVINSDITNSGNNNDGNTTFFIECKIRADYQGILKIGGVSRVYNYGELNSGILGVPVNVNLKAFLLMGGQFRNFNTSVFTFAGARTDGFVFTPTGGFTPSLVGQSSTIVSYDTITNLFNKTNNNNASLTFNNSDSGVQLSITNIFESTNLWNVLFNKNVFESGLIDETKADLTAGNLVSVSNSIGANLFEHLRRFNDRADAIANSVPLYSAYLKTNGVAYPTTTGWVRDIVLPL